MIITQLIGGLGNQMFQYCAGYVAAKLVGTEFKIDNRYYLDHSKRFHRFTYRPYGLSLFNITTETATTKEISLFTTPRTSNKYIYHFKHLFKKDYNVLSENAVKDLGGLSCLPKDCYLTGFFQKFSYFADFLSEIKYEFTFKDPLPSTHNEIKAEIQKSEEPICVVFRRGDYVGHPSLDVVDLNFYYGALEVIEEKRREEKRREEKRREEKRREESLRVFR